jgi:hypothetical protein
VKAIFIWRSGKARGAGHTAFGTVYLAMRAGKPAHFGAIGCHKILNMVRLQTYCWNAA